MKLCDKCGNQITSSNNYCSNCGNTLNKNDTPTVIWVII